MRTGGVQEAEKTASPATGGSPPVGAMYKFRTSISVRKCHGFHTGVPGATNEEAMAWLLGFRACSRHIPGL